MHHILDCDSTSMKSVVTERINAFCRVYLDELTLLRGICESCLRVVTREGIFLPFALESVFIL